MVNVFAQDGCGHDKCYTDYEAMRTAFHKLAISFRDSIFRIPYKMGCGLAGGNWDTVLTIINEELVDKGCEVEIWRLN